MSAREELKELYDNMTWEQEQLRKQLKELENKFTSWKQAYAIIEDQLKIFKQLLKDF